MSQPKEVVKNSIPPHQTEKEIKQELNAKATVQYKATLPVENKEPNTQQIQLTIHQPAVIKIESETDWPLLGATIFVGVGSILITLVIGWLAVATQKSQIKSSTAHFRHDWQKELREKISEFIGKISFLHFQKRFSIEGSENPPSRENNLSEIVKLQVVIELMLDKKKESTTEFIQLMSDSITSLQENNPDNLSKTVTALTDKGNLILEQAWKDIRRDVGARQ
jgi:hypothetical protein